MVEAYGLTVQWNPRLGAPWGIRYNGWGHRDEVEDYTGIVADASTYVGNGRL
jgi:hypothetical protein